MTMADEQGPELTARMRAIREIFDREIAQAEYDIETSAHIAWMKGLRDEVCDGAPFMRGSIPPRMGVWCRSSGLRDPNRAVWSKRRSKSESENTL